MKFEMGELKGKKETIYNKETIYIEKYDSENNGFFNFDKLIIKKLIVVLFPIGGLGIIIGGFNAPLDIVYKIFIILFGLLVWRIICEQSIISFKIHDKLESIEKYMGAIERNTKKSEEDNSNK